ARGGRRDARRRRGGPPWWWYAASALVVAAGAAASVPSGAESGGSPQSWSAPSLVAEAEETLAETAVVADPAGAVHLFFAGGQSAGPGTTPPRYARWEGGRWSGPWRVNGPQW